MGLCPTHCEKNNGLPPGHQIFVLAFLVSLCLGGEKFAPCFLAAKGEHSPGNDVGDQS